MSWIPIFKPGTHTDAAGNTRTWSDADVRNMVKMYNEQSPAEKHDAPAVKGHPKTDDPALGWVDSLKYEGGQLWAKLRDMQKSFVEEVKSGAYKKVSVRLYPNNMLRHVGFLGAVPPAIKGLGDVELAEYEGIFFNEEDVALSDIAFSIAEPEPEPKTVVVTPNENQPPAPPTNTKQENNFNQHGDYVMDFNDLKDSYFAKLKGQVSDDTYAKAFATFSEVFSGFKPKATTEKPKDSAFAQSDEYKAMLKRQMELELKTRTHDIADFIANETPLAGIAKTKAFPVIEMAYRIDNPGDYQDFPLDLNFSEEDKKKPANELVKDFMRNLPKIVEFNEFGNGGTDNTGNHNEDIENAVATAQGVK
ncbi:MAG: hypothetical protein M9949_06140 [Candidatus Kapabacteria bacterium]|nr:hypothetical protein [Candidatus Kapabacteria bacterium]